MPNLHPLLVDIVELQTSTASIDTNVTLLIGHQPNVADQIAQAENKLSQLEGISSLLARLRQQINTVSREIDALDLRIADVRAKHEQLQDLHEQRIQTYSSLMLKVIDQRSFLQRAFEYQVAAATRRSMV